MNESPPNSAFISYGSASQTGRVHTTNEDRVSIPDGIASTTLAQKGQLFVVADGMGGHSAGSVASQIAVDVIQQIYYADPALDVARALDAAITSANTTIRSRGQQSPGCENMGATVVAAVVRGNELTVASAGDSRAYVLRQDTLQQLTVDHTWVAERVAAGILTPAEANQHDLRHMVTRSLGHKPGVEVDIKSLPILPGDRLLLCCDGVWEPLGPSQLARWLGAGNPQAAASALVAQASASGSDDATALVVDLVQAGARHGTAHPARVATLSRSQRTLVAGAAITLTVVLLGVGYAGLRANRAAGAAKTVQEKPTTAAVRIRPSMLPSAPAAEAETEAMPSPATPTHNPTSTPVPTPTPGEEQPVDYCIVPATNEPEALADLCDGDCNPEMQLKNGTPIQVPDDNLAIDMCYPLYPHIEVLVDDGAYWVWAWRVGTLGEDEECHSIDKWREYFSQPRRH